MKINLTEDSDGFLEIIYDEKKYTLTTFRKKGYLQLVSNTHKENKK